MRSRKEPGGGLLLPGAPRKPVTLWAFGMTIAIDRTLLGQQGKGAERLGAWQAIPRRPFAGADSGAVGGSLYPGHASLACTRGLLVIP